MQQAENGESELLRRLHEHGTQLVLMKACTQPEDVMKGIESGAADFLQKPVSTHRLRNIWQHVVRKVVPLECNMSADCNHCRAGGTAEPPSLLSCSTAHMTTYQLVAHVSGLWSWSHECSCPGISSRLMARNLNMASATPGASILPTRLPDKMPKVSQLVSRAAVPVLKSADGGGVILPHPETVCGLPAAYGHRGP